MLDRTTPNGYRSVGRKSSHSLSGLMSVIDVSRVSVDERRTGVGSLLNRMTIPRGEEGVVRKAVKKGSLLHDLVYRVLDRRGIVHSG